MRLAVVGIGGHAFDHLRTAQELGYRLTHVVDRSDDAIDKGLSGLGLRWRDVNVLGNCRDLTQAALLPDGTRAYDGIIVGTPDKFHAGNLHSLVHNMPAGVSLPILLEKPGATNLRNLPRFVKALRTAERKGIAVTTCYLRRCDPPYIWLKENINGLIEMYGQLRKIELTFDYPIPDDLWKLRGRSLALDHAVHELDYLLWLLGQYTLIARLIEDGPLEYKMEGTYGDVEFFFHGKRLSNRVPTPDFPRGEYIEAITLHFDNGVVCELNAHTGTFRVTRNGSVIDEPEVGETDYDLRLKGVMASFAKLAANTGEPLVSPDEFWWSTDAVVKLVRFGRHESSPNL